MEPPRSHPAPGRFRAPARALLGLAVALAVLVLAELLLGFFPLDRYERGFPAASYPVFVRGEGSLAAKYVTNPHFKTSLNPQVFARTKPPGLKRIFVLGGSAAKGWPGDDATAFTGFLRRALDAVHPGRFEIVNAAGHSYASHRVLDVLYDVVGHDPDLVIVYCGNNEYVERNALPAAARSRSVLAVTRVLRRSALYRAVRLAVHGAAPFLFARPSGPDLTDLRAEPVTRRSGARAPELDGQVLDNYRANLAEIARVLRDRKVAALFCTVPVNLAKWAPALLPPLFVDSRSADRGAGLIQKGFEAYRAGDYGGAAALLGDALETTPRYATGRYVRGDALRRLGRYAEAREELAAACECDGRPIRAFPSFNRAVLETGARFRIPVVDLAGGFASASGNDLVGLDLFLDYCHPNDAGHKLIARLVLEGAARLRGLSPIDVDGVVRRIAADTRSSLDSASAPVNYALGMTRQNLGDLAEAERCYRESLKADPRFAEALYNLGAIRYRRGDREEAESLVLRSLDRDPNLVPSLFLMGLLKFRDGRNADARAYLSRLLVREPTHSDALELMGDIAAAAGEWPAAMGYYGSARSAGGDHERLRGKIADVEAAQRRSWAPGRSPRAGGRPPAGPGENAGARAM